MICDYCEFQLGGRIESHHIHPKSWGGEDTAGNRTNMHADCHREYHLVLNRVGEHLGGKYRNPHIFKLLVRDVLEHSDNPRYARALRVVQAMVPPIANSAAPADPSFFEDRYRKVKGAAT